MKKSTIMASTVIAAGTYFFTQCKCLKNSYYNIINKKIPESFDGYKIIQLSDKFINYSSFVLGILFLGCLMIRHLINSPIVQIQK